MGEKFSYGMLAAQKFNFQIVHELPIK